jgi:hypothetical protein
VIDADISPEKMMSALGALQNAFTLPEKNNALNPAVLFLNLYLQLPVLPEQSLQSRFLRNPHKQMFITVKNSLISFSILSSRSSQPLMNTGIMNEPTPLLGFAICGLFQRGENIGF